MVCRYLAFCPFFRDNVAKNPALAGTYKNSYCNANQSNCARYLIARALGRDSVPSDLFPDQMNRAERIILEKQKQK
jgi:hypothetical protein